MAANASFPLLSFNMDDNLNSINASLKVDGETGNSQWLDQDKEQDNFLRKNDFAHGLAPFSLSNDNTTTRSMQDFMLQGIGSDDFNSSAMSSNTSQESQSQDPTQWPSSYPGMPFLNLQWQQQAHLGNNPPFILGNSFDNSPRQSSYSSTNDDHSHTTSSASPPFTLMPTQPTRSSTNTLWQRRLTSKHQSLEGHYPSSSVPDLMNQASTIYGPSTHDVPISSHDSKHSGSCHECNHLSSFSSLQSINATAAALLNSVSTEGSDHDSQLSIQHTMLPLRHSSWDSMVASSNTFDPSILQGAQWMPGHHSLNSHSSHTSDYSFASSSLPTSHLSPTQSNNAEGDLDEEISDEDKDQDVDENKRHKASRNKEPSSSSAAPSSSSATKGVINKVVLGRGGETRHLCPQAGCSKTFSTSGHARRHSRIHSSLRPFQCSSCTSTFSRRDNCVSHERSRHGTSKH